MSQTVARAAVALFFFASAFFVALSASAACPPLSRALARGARGADVTALQQFLIGQGVLSADSATGYFGPLTERAVQNFQKSKSVVLSGTPASTGFGLVGKRTQAAIALACAGGASTLKERVTPKLKNPNCPAVELPIGTSCKYKWKEVKDAAGCAASWQCTR